MLWCTQLVDYGILFESTTLRFSIAMKEEDDDGAFAEDKEEYIEDLEEMEYEGELTIGFVL